MSKLNNTRMTGFDHVIFPLAFILWPKKHQEQVAGSALQEDSGWEVVDMEMDLSKCSLDSGLDFFSYRDETKALGGMHGRL